MPYHLWEQSQVLVALENRQVVGTLTLVFDNATYGLPMESAFPSVIRQLRNQGLRVGEVCSLAIDHGGRRSTPDIFAQLTRLMMFHARFQGTTRLAAVVHPRHAWFYRRAMSFQTAGKACRYAQVEGQPGIPVLGDINEPAKYRPRWRRFYFEGECPAAALAPRPMRPLERAYFGQLLTHPISITQRKAA